MEEGGDRRVQVVGKSVGIVEMSVLMEMMILVVVE